MIDDLFFIFGLNQLVRESLKKKEKKNLCRNIIGVREGHNKVLEGER